MTEQTKPIRPLSDEQQARVAQQQATVGSAEHTAKANYGNSKPIPAYPQKDVPEHIPTGQE